jgi:hypothetical protein
MCGPTGTQSLTRLTRVIISNGLLQKLQILYWSIKADLWRRVANPTLNLKALTPQYLFNLGFRVSIAGGYLLNSQRQAENK